MSSFTYRQLNNFDNTGLFSSRNETSYFPFHYHDLFCVTLIQEGVEILETTTDRFITEAGTISIIPPGEMHRNFSLTDTGYTYETIYLSPELLRYFNAGKKVMALERSITDQKLFNQLHALFINEQVDEPAWKESFLLLNAYSVTPETVYVNDNKFMAIDAMIEECPDKVSDNEWLSKQFYMSPFNFIRAFKRAQGVPPQRYILIKKLSKAQKLLLLGIPVKEVAYLMDFSSPSHFINSFKKIYGLAPGAFSPASSL